MSVASWCCMCFCVLLCVSFCTGNFVIVPLNLTYLHCLLHSLFEHLFNLYNINRERIQMPTYSRTIWASPQRFGIIFLSTLRPPFEKNNIYSWYDQSVPQRIANVAHTWTGWTTVLAQNLHVSVGKVMIYCGCFWRCYCCDPSWLPVLKPGNHGDKYKTL